MNIKLTNQQKLNLMYLANNRFIEVCTSVGRSLGCAVFPDGNNAKSIMAAFNTFLAWGYFDEEEKHYHGLRYSRFTVNEKGKQALLNAEVVSE
jgi:hypothetical protein